jgi:hypothetical protein
MFAASAALEGIVGRARDTMIQTVYPGLVQQFADA